MRSTSFASPLLALSLVACNGSAETSASAATDPTTTTTGGSDPTSAGGTGPETATGATATSTTTTTTASGGTTTTTTTGSGTATDPTTTGGSDPTTRGTRRSRRRRAGGGGTYAMPATTPLDFMMPGAWDKKYFDKDKVPNTPMFQLMNLVADTLGAPPYNPNDPESFGCEGCHLAL